MCWPFDFSIVILRVIFDTFYTSFGYKNWNIETNISKFCIKVYFNGLLWMKNFALEIFVGFGWFWLIWTKKSVFLSKILFKGYTGKFTGSYNHENWQMDAESCFGKFVRGRILIYFIIFQEKIWEKKLNSALKKSKNWKIKIPPPMLFLKYFSASTCQFLWL